jgi:hypothetical protein
VIRIFLIRFTVTVKARTKYVKSLFFRGMCIFGWPMFIELDLSCNCPALEQNRGTKEQKSKRGSEEQLVKENTRAEGVEVDWSDKKSTVLGCKRHRMVRIMPPTMA